MNEEESDSLSDGVASCVFVSVGSSEVDVEGEPEDDDENEEVSVDDAVNS